MTLFSSLGLSEPLLRAVREKGYDTATPIQAQAIPVILAGLGFVGLLLGGYGAARLYELNAGNLMWRAFLSWLRSLFEKRETPR